MLKDWGLELVYYRKATEPAGRVSTSKVLAVADQRSFSTNVNTIMTPTFLYTTQIISVKGTDPS